MNSKLLLLAGASLIHASVIASPQVEIQRHDPLNLFDADENIRFVVTGEELPGREGVRAVLTNELGAEVARRPVEGPGSEIEVDLGRPGRGFYELQVFGPGRQGDEEAISRKISLGVTDFVDRTAKQVREEGYVFGLKWWSGIQRQAELAEAMSNLGLQWTRVIQNEGASGKSGKLSIGQMFREYPLNAVVKVERFPIELYDAEKYGPLKEWEKQFGRGHWVIKTLPQKGPYQSWLKEQIKAIPEDQNVFEIWNEPWDKMGPEEFAELAQWAAQAILEVRPNAIIGPNLKGETGKYDYDARVINAGGMKGMKMVALHPYSAPEDRKWLREYKTWLKEKMGRDMEIYITEYGSHSTPEGPQKKSEMKMAREVARASVLLYSEGVKALIPHVAGSSEKDRTYYDDWMGFLRKTEEPKPVLVAHANVARMIDGSKYLGDLWFGPQVEAFVFERRGERVLTLWTKDPSTSANKNEETQARKDFDVETDAPQVTVTDLLGRETLRKSDGGKIKLTIDESPLFVSGIGPKAIAGVSKELREDRWPKPKVTKTHRTARRLAKVPTWNGAFDDWEGATQVVLWNPSVNGSDAIGTAHLAWNEDYLLVGLKVKDNEIFNKQTRNKLYRGDSLELFVSTEPRDSGGGFGPRDHQFILTPTSSEGRPVISKMTERENGILEDIADAKYFAGRTADGWAIELGIPWSAIDNIKPEKGVRIALDMRLNDQDTSHERWKLDPSDAETFSVFSPFTWSTLELSE